MLVGAPWQASGFAEQFSRGEGENAWVGGRRAIENYFSNTPLSTTRSFIGTNRNAPLGFLRGFTQGLQRLWADKDFSMKVLSKYAKATEVVTLCQLHQSYGIRYSGDRIPLARPESIDEILKRTPGKGARDAKAGDFIDNSLLQELDKSGWFKRQAK